MEVAVGSKVWLSTEHLRLPAGLTRKLALRYGGPFMVLEAVTPVSFRVELP